MLLLSIFVLSYGLAALALGAFRLATFGLPLTTLQRIFDAIVIGMAWPYWAYKIIKINLEPNKDE